MKKNFIALTSYLTLKYNSWGKCSLNVQFSVKCTIQCNENRFWWYIGMKNLYGSFQLWTNVNFCQLSIIAQPVTLKKLIKCVSSKLKSILYEPEALILNKTTLLLNKTMLQLFKS